MSMTLFGRLADHAEQKGDPVTNRDAARWIARKDETDAALMAHAKAKAKIVTRQIRLVRVEHDGECYFCTFGLPEPEDAPPYLEVIDTTPGIFSVAVLEAQVWPLMGVTAAEIKQALDARHGGSAGYEGHELSEVEKFFPPLLVYRSVEASPYHAITDRVLGAILARAYFDGPIYLDPDTVAALTNIFENGSDRIPFLNLVQGVLSISWENLFLEIYRCVEQLYGVKRFGALKAALNFASSPRDLAELLEEKLAWRPKEAEAFTSLVQLCDETLISNVCINLSIEADEHQKRCAKIVDSLYGLRNVIVHYRPSHKRVKKSEAEWNLIIRSMLSIVAQIYNDHADEYFAGSIWDREAEVY
jgi:hypothetical protein